MTNKNRDKILSAFKVRDIENLLTSKSVVVALENADAEHKIKWEKKLRKQNNE